ncbi:SHOCT domain-containing protein [Hymenobacter sp. H14-R3]|uniref:SHOCT domain-containing protein n=1 Tax=Hymenobacter sp. H14-R3 TaxID=3046308 RepID=UPI0024BB056D|nr:SHOCT domain-containing protein [Hymenobacter sp. H14-R3]MDJ0363696.1 SHOCT domain-containing protein [Hymenobacter sp. H14-R3]
MNPSDAHSSLAALRQLKEMLDAGTITPQEFEILKRQLIFGLEPALPISQEDNSSDSVLPLDNELPDSILPEAPAPIPEATIAAYDTIAPNPAELAAPPPAAAPDWLAAPAASAPPAGPDPRFAEESRNPLNLVFIIGGALVVLGLVLYLFMSRPAAPDEHLASASQTAADSTAVAPEVGPQADQITLPPAVAPETIRVAPVARPVVPAAASQFKADSVAAPVVAPPPAKVPAAVVPTTTISTDSATKAP